MRIFEILSATANYFVAANRTWYRNLYEPLVEIGHEVVLFSADEGKRAMRQKDETARSSFSQKVLDTFRKEQAKKPFDLFFSYLMDGMIDPNVIDEIRKTGVPTCNFSCNNTHQFYHVDELSPHFDYNLHSERDAREKFLAIGATPVWWPMASNPNYFKPYDLPRKEAFSFVGANYALRARYIAHLLENGIDVQVFGPNWQHKGRPLWRHLAKRHLLLLKTLTSPSSSAQVRTSSLLTEYDFCHYLSMRFPNNFHVPVSDEEMIALYSRSQLSLGFLEVFDRHDPIGGIIRHVHLREFEAPMSGALYCTGYMDELAEFFEPDKEVIMYCNEHWVFDIRRKMELAPPGITCRARVFKGCLI